MSPLISMCTATTSASGAISGTKSPGGTMLTMGTLIMMRVRCERGEGRRGMTRADVRDFAQRVEARGAQERGSGHA